ncbi:PspA/IM30 family protein [Croceimicrobium hydrocarbonivorans]|uniref:PspA/IM30 family protein n=1 Tax=Croceimicrobium hydrocarbonivorans TaxID=2761580 RepID=A0A7H0VHM2_9FLAO|nr:PspA/IM30 family protein [Croceimicrobium hydrocarbonivorans]QNR25220.1 PspA/IM30 family protein [Croceimicrobium hydrocarbonivorans]
MSIFKRLFSIGKAEANSALDKLEDPIKMTEQGIRDLKVDLDKALQSLAEIKALSIRARNDSNTYQAKAKDYENKAIALLRKVENGEMESSEADRLAGEALNKKKENEALMNQAKADKEKFDGNIDSMDSKIKRLRQQISQYENELKTLKARVKVSSATKNINKQMAQIDSSSTVSLLERMKDKVAEEEALAESYGDIANESRSLDEEIDRALEDSGSASEDLAALKAKMGLNKDANPEGEGEAKDPQ